MLIVIAGIKRSGSTAQYNMVRLIMETQGEVNCTGNPAELKEGVNILKLHTFDNSVFKEADYIFTTDRDSEEIQESLKALGQHNRFSMLVMKRHLKMWRRKSLHHEYTDIINEPKKCIKEIAEHLGVKVDVQDIYKKFIEVKPSKKYDPKTMLFPNHRR